MSCRPFKEFVEYVDLLGSKFNYRPTVLRVSPIEADVLKAFTHNYEYFLPMPRIPEPDVSSRPDQQVLCWGIEDLISKIWKVL
jgi:hypothetical protein